MDNEQAEAIAEANATSTNADGIQPPLIKMSEEEVRDAGRKLAQLVEELVAMTRSHAAERQERAQARKELRERVEAVASTIRLQGR